jgi:hypothetical protein
MEGAVTVHSAAALKEEGKAASGDAASHQRDCGYLTIVPQAMRAPALPAGSLFMSSAAA